MKHLVDINQFYTLTRDQKLRVLRLPQNALRLEAAKDNSPPALRFMSDHALLILGITFFERNEGGHKVLYGPDSFGPHVLDQVMEIVTEELLWANGAPMHQHSLDSIRARLTKLIGDQDE